MIKKRRNLAEQDVRAALEVKAANHVVAAVANGVGVIRISWALVDDTEVQEQEIARAMKNATENMNHKLGLISAWAEELDVREYVADVLSFSLSYEHSGNALTIMWNYEI